MQIWHDFVFKLLSNIMPSFANLRPLLKHFGVFITIASVATCLGLGAGALYHRQKSHIVRDNFQQHIIGRSHAITLYGTSTCEYCTKARAFLKENGIAFNDVLIDQDRAEFKNFSTLQRNTVPILVTKTSLVAGYSPKEYIAIIKP